MTRAEAYTKDSYYVGRVFYHGTNGITETITVNGVDIAKTNPEGVLGLVFYASSSKAKAKEHAMLREDLTPSVLKMLLNVREPQIYNFPTDFADDADRRGIDLGVDDWETQLVQALQNQGFDAVEIKSLGYFCVLEPKQVAVFHKEEV